MALILAGRNTTSLQGIMLCSKNTEQLNICVSAGLSCILQDFRKHHKHNENDLPVLKQVENCMGVNRSVDPEVWPDF